MKLDDQRHRCCRPSLEQSGDSASDVKLKQVEGGGTFQAMNGRAAFYVAEGDTNKVALDDDGVIARTGMWSIGL